MKIYHLYSCQALTMSMEDAWDFLSNPANLGVITPEHMGFRIISGGDRPMYPGQIIQYKVSPFKGINTNWVTEITHVKKGKYFVDEQRFGPYSFWHHKHFIRPQGDWVLMEDLIDYKLPLGVLGQMMNSLVVKKQLSQIFNYRENKLKELFGTVPNSSSKFSIS